MARPKGSKNKVTATPKAVPKEPAPKKVKAPRTSSAISTDLAGYARPKDNIYKIWYTQVLRGEKNIPHKVVSMEVSDYIGLIGKHLIDERRVTNIATAMASGSRFPMPYWDIDRKRGGDVDVAVAASKSGETEIQVLIVAGNETDLKKV